MRSVCWRHGPAREDRRRKLGKTGTAQNRRAIMFRFVAYATVNNEPSRIAVAVLVEHGEHGASAAVPIAKAVIEAALRAELPSKAKPTNAPAPPQGQKLLLPPATHTRGVL